MLMNAAKQQIKPAFVSLCIRFGLGYVFVGEFSETISLLGNIVPYYKKVILTLKFKNSK